jgi:hypothetical protein
MFLDRGGARVMYIKEWKRSICGAGKDPFVLLALHGDW